MRQYVARPGQECKSELIMCISFECFTDFWNLGENWDYASMVRYYRLICFTQNTLFSSGHKATPSSAHTHPVTPHTLHISYFKAVIQTLFDIILWLQDRIGVIYNSVDLDHRIWSKCQLKVGDWNSRRSQWFVAVACCHCFADADIAEDAWYGDLVWLLLLRGIFCCWCIYAVVCLFSRDQMRI